MFQELNVVDQLTVEENLTLGLRILLLDSLKIKKNKKILEALNSIEPSIDPKQRVSRLSVAKANIEIAKAVASESDIIIMDEPTAAISECEIKRLLKL